MRVLKTKLSNKIFNEYKYPFLDSTFILKSKEGGRKLQELTTNQVNGICLYKAGYSNCFNLAQVHQISLLEFFIQKQSPRGVL